MSNNQPTAAEVAARIFEVVDYQDVKAHTAQVVFAMSHVKFLARSWQEQQAEIERLRAAIKKHRLNVWGAGPVEHYDDVEL